MEEQKPLAQLEELLGQRQEQGYIAYEDLLKILQSMVLDAQEVQQLYDRLEQLELPVLEELPVPENIADQVLPKLTGETEEARTVIGFYLDEVREMTALSQQEEALLFERLEAGDEDARNRICESNLGLVVAVAIDYLDKKVPFLDLIQEGSLGLIRAAECYDRGAGYRFGSFAPWHIRLAILRCIADTAVDRTMPDKLAEMVDEMLQMTAELEKTWNRTPTEEEVADEMGISPDQIRELMRIASDQVEEKD